MGGRCEGARARGPASSTTSTEALGATLSIPGTRRSETCSRTDRWRQACRSGDASRPRNARALSPADVDDGRCLVAVDCRRALRAGVWDRGANRADGRVVVVEPVSDYSAGSLPGVGVGPKIGRVACRLAKLYGVRGDDFRPTGATRRCRARGRGLQPFEEHVVVKFIDGRRRREARARLLAAGGEVVCIAPARWERSTPIHTSGSPQWATQASCRENRERSVRCVGSP